MPGNFFIAPELFPIFQAVANSINEILVSLDLTTPDLPISGRTVAMEILATVAGDACGHVLVKRFNKKLFSCSGCYKLFRDNDKTKPPLELFKLIEESLHSNKITQLRKLIKDMESVRQVLEVKELRIKNHILDLEYKNNQRSTIEI